MVSPARTAECRIDDPASSVNAWTLRRAAVCVTILSHAECALNPTREKWKESIPFFSYLLEIQEFIF
jgi:hypothetical protein